MIQDNEISVCGVGGASAEKQQVIAVLSYNTIQKMTKGNYMTWIQDKSGFVCVTKKSPW